jgi:hypothetical protein
MFSASQNWAGILVRQPVIADTAGAVSWNVIVKSETFHFTVLQPVLQSNNKMFSPPLKLRLSYQHTLPNDVMQKKSLRL